MQREKQFEENIGALRIFYKEVSYPDIHPQLLFEVKCTHSRNNFFTA
jgi:hypothetical protein